MFERHSSKVVCEEFFLRSLVVSPFEQFRSKCVLLIVQLNWSVCRKKTMKRIKS